MRRGTDGVELLSARCEETPRAELFDASGAAFPAPPEFTLLHERELSWPAKFGVQRLLHAGLKMAEDGKSVFTYNPQRMTIGMNFLRVWAFAPRVLGLAFWAQSAVIIMIALVWKFTLSDSEPGGA